MKTMNLNQTSIEPENPSDQTHNKLSLNIIIIINQH
jgi:hypothetical protein